MRLTRQQAMSIGRLANRLVSSKAVLEVQPVENLTKHPVVVDVHVDGKCVSSWLVAESGKQYESDNITRSG